MYESGYYPPGAEHDPHAPWNEKEPNMVKCDGVGEVEYEEDYEPDYDDYYEQLLQQK